MIFFIKDTDLQVPVLVRVLPVHIDFVLQGSCGISLLGVLWTLLRSSHQSCIAALALDSVGI